MPIRFHSTLFLVLYLFPITFGYSPNDAKTWCSQTPHPKPCEDFLSHNPTTTPIKEKSQFFKISTQLALDRAIHAQTNMYSFGSSKFQNAHEKTAWDDCLELFDLTIQKLNKTVNPTTKCTQDDSQTWLSTALTNLETCREGNTLAINKAPYTSQPNYKNGFPTWVKPGDRKLLQSSSAKADVVVAKDGSWNYKTISEAVSAASKRKGSARYVIYVKAGTYKENVQIKSKNIMLRGDGIGKTIITGSKSVGGGSTTFNSATVAVVGDGFIAQDITFQNTAGPTSGQAVALRDAVHTWPAISSGRQFSTTTVCLSVPHPPLPLFFLGGVWWSVAAIKVHHALNTWIMGALPRGWPAHPHLPLASLIPPGVGTPPWWWQICSWWCCRHAMCGCSCVLDLGFLSGWMEWSGNFALKTLYYGEYMNTGPGSSTSNRVKWAGYHVITSASEASKFTVGNFIAGNSWLPATNVPFTSGL
ncbi:unnamed protein product [Prunus armeniaca]|uniref:Pectinesterase n=1 Tax=Prunus armeniaca TaxID=36596 RepID=A0A6J5U037_PRUAR|nr:unnamed protein product [Prunus armeniaca]